MIVPQECLKNSKMELASEILQSNTFFDRVMLHSLPRETYESYRSYLDVHSCEFLDSIFPRLALEEGEMQSSVFEEDDGDGNCDGIGNEDGDEDGDGDGDEDEDEEKDISGYEDLGPDVYPEDDGNSSKEVDMDLHVENEMLQKTESDYSEEKAYQVMMASMYLFFLFRNFLGVLVFEEEVEEEGEGC